MRRTCVTFIPTTENWSLSQNSEAITKNATFEIAYRVVRPDGEIRVVQERGEPLLDDAGRTIRVIGTVHDVTDRIAAEAALKESEKDCGSFPTRRRSC